MQVTSTVSKLLKPDTDCSIDHTSGDALRGNLMDVELGCFSRFQYWNLQNEWYRPSAHVNLRLKFIKSCVMLGFSFFLFHHFTCRVGCIGISSAEFLELTFTFASLCHRPSVCLSVCLSVVCNVRAPYSGDWNFRQFFYAIWYLLTSR